MFTTVNSTDASLPDNKSLMTWKSEANDDVKISSDSLKKFLEWCVDTVACHFRLASEAELAGYVLHFAGSIEPRKICYSANKINLSPKSSTCHILWWNQICIYLLAMFLCMPSITDELYLTFCQFANFTWSINTTKLYRQIFTRLEAQHDRMVKVTHLLMSSDQERLDSIPKAGKSDSCFQVFRKMNTSFGCAKVWTRLIW